MAGTLKQAFCHLCDIISKNQNNLLTPLSCFSPFEFTNQREEKHRRMKGFPMEQQMNLAYPHTDGASNDRHAGRLADKIQMDLNFLKFCAG